MQMETVLGHRLPSAQHGLWVLSRVRGQKMGVTTTAILFSVKTGMGSGSITGLDCLCPVLMWECWSRWGWTLVGHPVPQLCTPEPVFPVTLLHAVVCSWASAPGLCRWGRKQQHQVSSWCLSEGSYVTLAFQGSATQYLTWASASMWPGEFPVNIGILPAEHRAV